MKKKIGYQVLKGSVFILIHVYQHTFSILLGPCCRFTPSCSSYALQSIQRFGMMKGTKLFLKRLIRCHPFNPGGDDPVPDIPKKF